MKKAFKNKNKYQVQELIAGFDVFTFISRNNKSLSQHFPVFLFKEQ